MAGETASEGFDLLANTSRNSERAAQLKKERKLVLDAMARHGLTYQSTQNIKYDESKSPEREWKVNRALLALVKNPAAFVTAYRTAEDKVRGARPSTNVEKDLIDRKETLPQLADVQITGDRAKGTLVEPGRGVKGRKQPIEFVKVGGGWKIAPPPGWEKVPRVDIWAVKLDASAVKRALLGTWKVKVGPTFQTEWTFQTDGTVLSSKGQPRGKWSIDAKNNRVLIAWNAKDWESLSLPLDTKGSTGNTSTSTRWRVEAQKVQRTTTSASTGKVKPGPYKTPQELFGAYVEAIMNKDRVAMVRLESPAGLRRNAGNYAYWALERMRWAKRSDDGKIAGVDFKPAFDVMVKHGLTEMATKEIQLEGDRKVRDKARQELAAKIKDPAAFYAEMNQAANSIDRSGRKEDDDGPPPGFSAKLTDVKIDGNKATATVVVSLDGKEAGKETIQFEKVGAGWTIVPMEVMRDEEDAFPRRGRPEPGEKKKCANPWNRKTLAGVHEALIQRLPADQARPRRVAAILACLHVEALGQADTARRSRPAAPNARATLPGYLSPLVTACTPSDLAEVLRWPVCTGDVQAWFLAELGRRCRCEFPSVWDVVDRLEREGALDR